MHFINNKIIINLFILIKFNGTLLIVPYREFWGKIYATCQKDIAFIGNYFMPQVVRDMELKVIFSHVMYARFYKTSLTAKYLSFNNNI